MSQQHNNNSSATMHDIITEEAPPAYSPYPNLGERSMAFGPARAFETTPYQPQPQQSASNYIYSTPSNNFYQATQQTIQQPVIYHQQVATNPPPLPPRTNATSTTSISTLRYPAGYVCSICNNTGYTGQRTKCQQCWKSFAVPNANYGSNVRSPQGNIIYASPGDPIIGGQLCTNCRGKNKNLTHFDL
ncbi:6449_t:CDS:1 [Dentiscutata heterogama]|uniref:6449_t:CDS:1 n=1 Tax=Dentiscutata heterogama TaxID=1316150 RepID=A0ACA9K969_9GLOM|nr:6449_t:CDS:1 [Dentiscutata heterogama]